MRCHLLARAVLLTASVFYAGCAYTRTASDIPHLEQRNGVTKLIVDGRPYICVAGELSNTASADREGIKAIWPRLQSAHLNTVLSTVSWDLIEPEEGKFDFSMIDYQLEGARQHNLRLVFLWMASWKNGLSHFPPPWVKADPVRFPHAINEDGNPIEILSTFSRNNRDADARAFAAMMKHIREVDSRDHTVVGIQIENEVGVQGSTRDFCPAATREFNEPVPAQLMNYLVAHKNALRPELRDVWMKAGGKTSGTWEEVFGKNVPRTDRPVPNNSARALRAEGAELFDHTDEIFMAWHYAQYMGKVAAEGKKEYPIPMYVNTWLVQPRDTGPGDYPSGGPEPFVHDVWRAGGPAIDILAPDLYLPQFEEVLTTYSRNGTNPIFIPETGQNSLNCWTAFTKYNALCFSPMGVDNMSVNSPFVRTYALVQALSGALAEAQGQPNAIKVVTVPQGQLPAKVEMGDYAFEFVANTGRGGAPAAGGAAGGATGRGGGRGPATAPAGGAIDPGAPATFPAATAPATRPATAPAGAGGAGGRAPDPGLEFMNGQYIVFVHTAPNEYYLATNGNFPFRIAPVGPGKDVVGPATVDRGYFQAGKWIRVHRYNGDELMRGGYDVAAAASERRTGTQVPFGISSGGRGGPAAEPATQPATQPATPAGPVVFRVTTYRY